MGKDLQQVLRQDVGRFPAFFSFDHLSFALFTLLIEHLSAAIDKMRRDAVNFGQKKERRT